ncbi:mechanosensitive ion channel family protein [Chryseobacterium indoltheticum]|uniref:Mechanosensitive ion channel family protein n=1 Tax=Chryseobacterium indoltheticum TaxID=254 RepID=A0A381FMX6_9FLAO|nr:mechanosensitive ion channel family protein [Chryseobacterium indoltheticum]AZA62271.1 mechanosensitive ion channel family protein [Chryseobacterium indoltheticum]QQQ27558.1 mechanosensitive ion channel family protein [Chryseobacterium indoltheticum]SUX47768.1 Small-conductance mechanosensitive channel [Chryseobacterium indoltheticum]
MKDLNLSNVQDNWENFITSAIAMAPRLITALVSAILIFIVGRWIIGLLKKLIRKAFIKKEVELSLQKFLLNVITWSLNILLFIIVVTQLGVQTSAFVAMIGAAGLAIGLALQGSLANFAGGILILMLKPFKVGDYIEVKSGESGTVHEIDIFHTRLITPQNQMVIIPNGDVSNNSITNYTHLGTRRTWFNIGVSYNANLNEAKKILLDVIKNNQYAFESPAPQVVVTELGDSAINLSIRATTSLDNFWTMNEELIINCKRALDNAGIEIPFPQRDLHIYQNS